MKIKNVPEYAKDCKFIVARKIGSEFWFYGAFNDIYKAGMCAFSVSGWTFPISEVEEDND